MGTIYVNVDIDVDDIIGDIDAEDLIDELESRGYEIVKEKEDVSIENKAFLINRMFFNKQELYRHLCDICDCGYHEPKNSLLNKIKDLL